MMNGASMMTGMGWSGLLLMLLLWGGVLALVLWGVSGRFPTARVDAEADALAILRHRYAQGEITREEFLQASMALHAHEPDQPGHVHRPGSQGQ